MRSYVPASIAWKIALIAFAVAVFVSSESPRDGSAAHVDPNIGSMPPNLWLQFFHNSPVAKNVRWRACLYMDAFGMTSNATSATQNWQNVHGYGISFTKEQSACNGDMPWVLGFRTTTQNMAECEAPPPPGFVILGCWMPSQQHRTYWNGWPAAFGANIWVNAPYKVAYGWSQSEITFNFAHEIGHSMGLGHHHSCQTVMSLGKCTNTVQVSDVYVPRCAYGYVC